MWDVIALAALSLLVGNAVATAARSHSRRRAWTAAPMPRGVATTTTVAGSRPPGDLDHIERSRAPEG
jgi:hypothetical protein